MGAFEDQIEKPPGEGHTGPAFGEGGGMGALLLNFVVCHVVDSAQPPLLGKPLIEEVPQRVGVPRRGYAHGPWCWDQHHPHRETGCYPGHWRRSEKPLVGKQGEAPKM